MRGHVMVARRIMVLSVIAGLALGIALSPCCRIREVVVHAPTQTIGFEFADKIDIPDTANTVFLPLKALQATAATCHRIRDIAVRRAGTGTIAVEIEERRPVAAVAYGGDFTTVDDEGVWLICTDTPRHLPVIKGLLSEKPVLGQRPTEAEMALIEACVRGAEEARLGEAAVFDLTNPRLVTVRTRDGVEGKLGDAANIRRKTVVFGRLLEGLTQSGQTVAHIDVRVENRPVCRAVAGRG